MFVVFMLCLVDTYMDNYKIFYNSKAWKDTRRTYKQSVGGLCERCRAKGLITPAEIIHHKIPLNADNVQDLELSLGWCNLQALCRKCHGEIHEELNGRPPKRYSIDDKGRIII
jgi:5-methylcytosine-specific restriction endonuclease McrA